MKISGRCSWFGGPLDDGVASDEGLAFIYEIDDAPNLFLPEQPIDPETGEITTGLARRLDPTKFYIACRWDYTITSKEDLLSLKVRVTSPETGESHIATPADWGPHEDTDRIADLSPGLMEALGITTDDIVEVEIPTPKKNLTIVISSGHGLLIRGASGFIDEVNEARRVVPEVAKHLRANGCTVYEFHDDTSTSQDQNLETIVNYHNSQTRDLDVSVHFNASEGTTEEPIGTECLYLTQEDLARRVATAIAMAGGLEDRGPKHRTGLYFLNNTEAPAILIEVCFVNSSQDAEQYNAYFQAICRAIANPVAPVEAAA